jgi:streptogramin lyase
MTNVQTASLERIDATGNVTVYPLHVTIGGQRFKFGPGNLAVGSDGNFYVGGRVAKMGAIAVVTTAGVVTNLYTLKNGPINRGALVHGPDGNVWFTAKGAVGSISTSGVVKTYASAGTDYYPMTVGPDGDLWFPAYASGNELRKISPTSGTQTSYPLSACPYFGAMAATSSGVNMVCPSQDYTGVTITMTPSGTQTTYSIPAGTIAVGPGGHAYLGAFLSAVSLLLPTTDEYVTFPSPTPEGFYDLTFDGSGALWALEYGSIARITIQ